MTTYVLTVSEFFPKTHKKSGKQTGFLCQLSITIKYTLSDATMICGLSDLKK